LTYGASSACLSASNHERSSWLSVSLIYQDRRSTKISLVAGDTDHPDVLL